MFGKVSYIGEVLQCHRTCDFAQTSHVLAFWVRQRSRSVPVLKYIQRHRIKKSQAQNCDICCELKLKSKSNCRIKIRKLATAPSHNSHKLGPLRQNPQTQHAIWYYVANSILLHPSCTNTCSL